MYTTSIRLLDQLREPATNQPWTRFVKLYTPLLHHWASKMPGMQAADAGDLVQDIFVILVGKLPSFQYNPTQSFRGWLRTIFVNRWRDRKKDREASEMPLPSRCQEEMSVPDHAEEIAAADYRQFLVGRALQLMRNDFEPATWQACWRSVALGQDPIAVAESLGLTKAAVYIARSRVLRRLRQELAGLLD